MDDNGVMTPRWLRVIRGGKLAPKTVSTVRVAGQRMRDGSYIAPEDRGLTRHFDADSIMETIRFIHCPTSPASTRVGPSGVLG